MTASATSPANSASHPVLVIVAPSLAAVAGRRRAERRVTLHTAHADLGRPHRLRASRRDAPDRRAAARARAHGRVTARDYAQTLELCRILGLEAEAFGAHGGAGRAGKLGALVRRTGALRRWARPRRFDLAVGHGSNDLALVARSLGIPAVDTFDYEWATIQHTIGCRLARRVIVPEAIPPERLRRYGVGPGKLVQYPGLKEEYYLSDFEPDRELLAGLGVDPARVSVIVRPPPDVSLYHRKSNPLFPQMLEHLGSDPGVHAVVLPRTAAQRRYVRELGLPSVIVPEGAVDGQSAVALGDVVVSAGRLDEPRGGRPGHAGVHDLRRSPRRGRRDAHPHRPSAARSPTPARSSSSSAPSTLPAPDAIRGSWWT